MEILDSVVWGGFGTMPEMLPELDNSFHRITINYSINYPSLLMRTQYRYRLNGGNWTAWDNDRFEEFPNLPSGSYTFEVQARDAHGQISDSASISFIIKQPWYWRWYMILLYLVLAAAVSYLFIIWRTQRLEKEKHRLESLVKERTAEVVKLEKVATVAKLTQGLIDRILNPLNYINNFAKLSEGLVKDVRANVEDEKENMDTENYEDTMDVLDMLHGNLQKVGEHGASTSRTLKAMEEMLKDRSGGIVKMNLTPLLHQNEEMVKKYFEKQIAEYGIKTVFELPSQEIDINGNAEQLSKTFMSILGNAIYAVVKQSKRKQGGRALCTRDQLHAALSGKATTTAHPRQRHRHRAHYHRQDFRPLLHHQDHGRSVGRRPVPEPRNSAEPRWRHHSRVREGQIHRIHHYTTNPLKTEWIWHRKQTT